MKLLVFSDSHGNTGAMIKIVRLEHPDGIFHLGDMVRDAQALGQAFPDVPLYSVCGNCDGMSRSPEEGAVTLEGKKILYLHGHTYRVKTDEGGAVAAARLAGADILLFGHTHRPLCELRNRLWILNPGSIGSMLSGTYGVISMERESATCYTSTVS